LLEKEEYKIIDRKSSEEVWWLEKACNLDQNVTNKVMPCSLKNLMLYLKPNSGRKLKNLSF